VRRPRTPLSRDVIAAAALQALDEDGLDGLGMRALARRLGVKASSLYNHVSGQDEVVELVHDLIDSEIDVSLADDPDWREGVGGLTRSYRAAFMAHPHAVAMVARRPLVAPNALAVYGALARALVRAGVPLDDVMPVMALLDYIVLGSSVDAFIEGFAESPEVYRDEHPELASAIEVVDRERVDDAVFEHALGLLLDDVERRIRPLAGHSAGPGNASSSA
jgi:AcrR family transcriptional regulator